MENNISTEFSTNRKIDWVHTASASKIQIDARFTSVAPDRIGALAGMMNMMANMMAVMHVSDVFMTDIGALYSVDTIAFDSEFQTFIKVLALEAPDEGGWYEVLNENLMDVLVYEKDGIHIHANDVKKAIFDERRLIATFKV